MKYTCIDSFSGAGGLSLGLHQAGFDVIYSFDIDSHCIETLNANQKFDKHVSECADINNLLNGNILKKTGLKRGELFLMAGGPPCQGFSIQRRGSDEDPRDELVLKYAQLVNETYPFFFIMENVSGLQGHRGKAILGQLISELEKIGYNVRKNLIDAEEYGVPQRRKRIIIVGERKDLGNSYEFPKPVPGKVTVRETIGFLPEPPLDGSDDPEYSLHRRDRLSKLNLKRINSITEGQGRDNLPKELLAKCHRVSSDKIGYRNVYGRMSWDDVAPTITARFDSFTRGLFGHPDQPRSITLREGALLQTFPIDYKFLGTKVEIAKQIGNAVPPKLAKKLGQSIIECYLRDIHGN